MPPGGLGAPHGGGVAHRIRRIDRVERRRVVTPLDDHNRVPRWGPRYCRRSRAPPRATFKRQIHQTHPGEHRSTSMNPSLSAVKSPIFENAWWPSTHVGSERDDGHRMLVWRDGGSWWAPECLKMSPLEPLKGLDHREFASPGHSACLDTTTL